MQHLLERQLLVDYGLKLAAAKLTFSTGGNLSIFLREKNLMLITPSAIPYAEISIDQIVIMNLEGEVVESNSLVQPSSEWRMHLDIYKHRKDVNCMIHAHATHLTTLAVLGWNLPPIDYLVAFSGAQEVSVAPYARYGTQILANWSTKYLGKDKYAVILANHGVNVVAENLLRAFAILENLEFCAMIYLKAKTVGEPILLTNQEIEELILEFKKYGV